MGWRLSTLIFIYFFFVIFSIVLLVDLFAETSIMLAVYTCKDLSYGDHGKVIDRFIRIIVHCFNYSLLNVTLCMHT